MPSAAVLNTLARASSLTRLELDFSAVGSWYGTVQPHRRWLLVPREDDDFTILQVASDGPELTNLRKALASLAQLRELHIGWGTPFLQNGGRAYGFNPLWPALQDLQHLTALTTTYIDSVMPPHLEYALDIAQHLPPSLQKLAVLPACVSIEDVSCGRVLVRHKLPYLGDLAHLTRLTELRAPAATAGQADFEQWGNGYWPRATDDDDESCKVLPASLEVLQLGCVQSQHMQQLLQLTKLHTMAIERAAGLTLGQLQQLQAMDAAHGGCLTSLCLKYHATERLVRGLVEAKGAAMLVGARMKTHAPCWPTLPLRRLSIDFIAHHYAGAGPNSDGVITRTQLECLHGGALPDAVLPHLAQLSGLTYLGLKCDLTRDVCETIAQLTGLQELRLAGGFGSRANEQQPERTSRRSEQQLSQQEAQEGLQELLAAAAELPQLKIVALQGLCGYLGPKAAGELARAAQLQRVELWGDSSLSAAEMQAVLVDGACKGCVVVGMPLEEGQQLEV